MHSRPVPIDDVIHRFLKPYIEKNFPGADMVLVGGSYGRAMKNGGYQPVSSSDIDLLIVYDDLEKAGYKGITQRFKMEDIGRALGGEAREIMLDCNIHDYKGLSYHSKMIKNDWRKPFTFNMLREAYVMIDPKNKAPALQRWAQRFVDAGPAPLSQGQCQDHVQTLNSFKTALKTATTAKERKVIALASYAQTANFALLVNGFWQTGTNQVYRYVERHMPDQVDQINTAFLTAIHQDKTDQLIALFDDLSQLGQSRMPFLPFEKTFNGYDPIQYLGLEAADDAFKGFIKFGLNHFCDALETSFQRGDMAPIATCNLALEFYGEAMRMFHGEEKPQGAAFAQRLLKTNPDVVDALLDAFDKKEFEDFLNICDVALAPMGGLYYKTLMLEMPEDIAMRKALKQNRAVKPSSNAPVNNSGMTK